MSNIDNKRVRYTHKVTSTCLNCPDRWVNESGRCHSTCERYIKFQRDLEDCKQELAEAKQRMGYEVEQYEAEKSVRINEYKEKMKKAHRRYHKDV